MSGADSRPGAGGRRALATLLRRLAAQVAPEINAAVIAHLDVGLTPIRAAVERLEAGATVTGERLAELRHIASDQVDGANDADEALGRVLAQLRREVADLTGALAAVEDRLERLDRAR